MSAGRRLATLVGLDTASSLSTGVGLAVTLIGVITGLAFGVAGLVFTAVLVVLALFVVAVATSPRRRGDGDGGSIPPPVAGHPPDRPTSPQSGAGPAPAFHQPSRHPARSEEPR